MKVFTVILFCVLAAVQGRVVSSNDEETSFDVPWFVHLRFSRMSFRGRLDSCVGTIYNKRWIITAASCLSELASDGVPTDSRFIWVRYDASNVYRPGFVTETTKVKIHPEYDHKTGANDIGLIDIDRDIEFTDKIQPIPLAASDAEVPGTGLVCGYGEKDGEAGEDLYCVVDTVTEVDGLLVAQSSANATRYDLGGALVSDGKVHAILVRIADETSAGAFLSTSKYVAWIEEETAEKEPEPEEEKISVVDGDDVLIAEPILTF
ncbi:trypsin beta-like [Pieris brassicae]|uniref:trypsin beta-like n=1 Tax=Pieris brassicae TaxID=7116 RepID=UPI001E661702|nr:trypsin beta-like [Pieris brassicae]